MILAQSYRDAKQLITIARTEAQRRGEEIDRMKKHIASLKAELKKVFFFDFLNQNYVENFKAKDDIEEARKSVESNADNPGPVPPPANKALKLDTRLDKSFSVDKVKRQIQGLTEQNDRMKRDLNAANQAEEGLMREMENTAKAVDDLMSQVCCL